MKKEIQILADLNPEQLQAVTYAAGSMLVLAGAGSGKTRVLTTKIAWLVQNNCIQAGKILAVTFTNKAAKEMLYRVSSLLAMDTKHMWIGTFHSIALRLLSKHHVEAGLPSYFQILDSQDQLGLLKRLIKAANLDEENYPARELQKFINNQKENGIRSGSLIADGLRQEHWFNLYTDYEAICNRDGLVDFTELLLRSYELLSTNEGILNTYRQQFSHILIDEFQDTNQLQYWWLKLLGDKGGAQLFAVGDDDQSIYSFRGAKVTNMKTFLKDFKVAEPIRLEQNYRSTPNILAAANAVISNNSERIGKNLWTKTGIGEKIRLYEGYTEEDEAYFVIDEIKALETKGILLSEIAILYRSNAQSRVFEQLFYTRNLPYRVYGGLRFFDRQEIKHVLCYLRLILNVNDNEAFLRVVNFPVRGIGAKTLENLQNLAKQHNVSLFQACNLLDGKSKLNLAKFTDLVNLIKIDCAQLSLPETISYIFEATSLVEHYKKDKRTGIERLENLNELISAVTNFRSEEGDDSLSAFLSYAVLESGDGQAQTHEHAVQLMTVHASKGLEFKVIFVVGLEDGLFPHENGLTSPRELEEERRLMYVAITRAREHLYLLRACSRLLWNKRQSAPISRFVNEIPGELISNISGISQIGCSSLADYGVDLMQSSSRSAYMDVVNPETKISRLKIADKDLVLKIGDMVKHNKFGKGKIMRLNADGKKMTAEIFFIGVGKKILDLNIAQIERA